MTEKPARNFALRDAKGNEIGIFSGKQPRQAALKAANRGVKDIRLRERGTKKVHIFTGERKHGKEAQERSDLDACKGMETQCQEGRRREA